VWLPIGNTEMRNDYHRAGWGTAPPDPPITQQGVAAALGQFVTNFGVGADTVYQVELFRDQRTGGTAAPPTYTIDQSGFSVTYDFQRPAGGPTITVTKRPSAVNGLISIIPPVFLVARPGEVVGDQVATVPIK
jgi:hypothetical protein